MKINIYNIIPGSKFNSKGGGYQPHKNVKGRRYHPAWDLVCEVGTPILSPGIGVVSYVDDSNDSDAGMWIELTFPKSAIKIKFMHLSKILVEEGDKIVDYQKVALSGNTGKSTGPHVHMQVYHFNVLVDPGFVFSK